MDIALALEQLVPAAKYGGSLNPRNRFDEVAQEVPEDAPEGTQPEIALVDSGEAMTEKQLYDALRWEDERAKPSWAQVQAAWNDVKGNAQWVETRIKRDSLLKASDWTQMPDSPLDVETKQAWAEYRTALRDITDDFESPDDVEWPEQPQ